MTRLSLFGAVTLGGDDMSMRVDADVGTGAE